jgi:hypothetical protein
MSDYMSVSQAAEKLGVTPRTIRRKIQKLPDDMSAYVRKEGKKYLIDVRLIKSDFKRFDYQELKLSDGMSDAISIEEQHQTIEREQSSIERDKVQEQQEPKQEQEQPNMIEYLNNQLDQKDKQIAGLLTQNLKLTDTVNAQNQLISDMQQERKVLLSPIEKNQPTEVEPPTAPTKKNKNRSDYMMMMILILLAIVIVLFVGKLDTF